ncbi:MAG: FHA domain-containing protein [Planctomycetes bacterium]|nr:Flp pilus assembly complex ATPase component TadA [Phycisphaerae bacterium]NBB96164.1 FHA domain-containing protein [Planctomycetota bacterium]
MEVWVYNQYSDDRETEKVPDEEVLIGRDDSCDVTLRSPFVSRKHARIFFDGGSYFIESLGQNGLTVTNKALPPHQQRKIDYGDEVRIGEFSLYMMQPSQRRIAAAERATSPRKRVIDLEQRMHAGLLDRLNLRVTGSLGDADEQLVTLIKRHLADIIDEHLDDVDTDMRKYLVKEYLWRSVVTELARRATGKLMYSYGFENTDVVNTTYEEAISRIIGNIIGYFPLQLRPHTLKDDIAKIEADWMNQLGRIAPGITPKLRDYIVRRLLSKEIEDVVLGYGPLQDLLEMPNVNEIMVVGKDRIYIEKDGVLQNTGRSFFTDQIVESIIERIITPIGRRIDRSQPLVDARLPDGSRVNAVINPLSLSGPTITIRKFARIPFTIDDLIERQTITEQVAAFLRACVIGRKNIMISGGTGSGKTTTLNVLSNFIPDEERIVTIEDSAELQLHQEHLARLETRPANIEGRGAYTIRDLVKNALRMRPDRLIVGEVRGPEALDMLQAMNTGHDGSLSTIHANTPDDTMLRLETMVLMAVEMPIKAIREQIVAALDLVVQITRLPGGERRVTHVSEVIGLDPDTDRILTEDVYVLRHREAGSDEIGHMRHTGYIPAFADQLIDDGMLEIGAFT